MHQVIVELKNFADELTSWSFERLRALGESGYFKDAGVEGKHVLQLEAECLQQFLDGEIAVLHVPVIATLGHRRFSMELFIEKGGTVHWDGNVYEFVGGVPRIVWSRSTDTVYSNGNLEGTERNA